MGRTIVRREFARTRANSPAFAANSPVFADCSPTFFSCEHWRTIGEHSANSREHWRSSREFARTRAESAAKWRTIRQKSVYIESFLTGVWFQIFGEQLFAAKNCSPEFVRTPPNSAGVRRVFADCSPVFAKKNKLVNSRQTRAESAPIRTNSASVNAANDRSQARLLVLSSQFWIPEI